MVMQELRETRGANFLFAFNEESDAEREVGTALQQLGKCHDRHEVRALVIGGAATPDTPIAHHGFKGGRGPKVQRISRLDVVVPVKHDVRPFGWTAATRQNDGVERGGHDLDLQASLLQQAADMLAGARHAGLKGGVGRDARVLDVFDEFADEIHGSIRQGRGRRARERQRMQCKGAKTAEPRAKVQRWDASSGSE